MGCNPPWGRSKLVAVDGAMDRHRYIQILRNQMLPWATGMFGRNFVYVQDNALFHTPRDTAVFLDQQDVEVTDWPTRGPDMNPIEHVWDQMSVWIPDMDDPASNVAQINNVVHQAWAAVRPEGCEPWSKVCVVVSGLSWRSCRMLHLDNVALLNEIKVYPSTMKCGVIVFVAFWGLGDSIWLTKYQTTYIITSALWDCINKGWQHVETNTSINNMHLSISGAASNGQQIKGKCHMLATDQSFVLPWNGFFPKENNIYILGFDRAAYFQVRWTFVYPKVRIE